MEKLFKVSESIGQLVLLSLPVGMGIDQFWELLDYQVKPDVNACPYGPAALLLSIFSAEMGAVS